MANTIRIKRRASGASGAPSSLANAELAFNEVDNILYYGEGTGGAGGTASSILAIGGDGAFVNLSGTQTISGNKTFTGTLDFSGATIASVETTGNVTVGGNLTVNGTTTTIESTTLQVDDKNIELGTVATPSDTTADGGGITLKGSTDKTFNWVNATDCWTSSENIDLLSSKDYKINGTSVLSGTTLGTNVVNSSLTTLGTITTGEWQGTTVAVGYGGTGVTSATNGQLLIGNASNGFTAATISAGTGITVTNGDGSIQISASGVNFSAGDGLDLTNASLTTDLTANGGLIFEGATTGSKTVSVDLGASAIVGTLAVSDGGTGGTTATDARTNLGLAIGTDVQAYDANLDALSGLQTGVASSLAFLTFTEIQILNGATVTTAELNIIDGDTSATATTLAATDTMVTNDGGTMVQVALSDLVTFFEDETVSGFSLDGGTF